jgi:hypothetical protein
VTGGRLLVTMSAALPDGTSLSVGANTGLFLQGAPVVPLAVIRTMGDAPPAGSGVGATLVATDRPITVAIAVRVWEPFVVPSVFASRSIDKDGIRVGQSAAQLHSIAGYLPWLDRSVPSPDAGDATSERIRRIAALEAVLARYRVS